MCESSPPVPTSLQWREHRSFTARQSLGTGHWHGEHVIWYSRDHTTMKQMLHVEEEVLDILRMRWLEGMGRECASRQECAVATCLTVC